MYLLVVEDDVNLGRALVKVLKDRYRVNWVRNLEGAKAHFEAAEYDLVLLDLGLPDGDGVEWLRALRAAGSRMPVLIVTARDGLDDRVTGLDTGADDYLVKPFEPRELLARIRALLRRQAGAAGPCITMGALAFEPEFRRFRLDGEVVELPPKEHTILAVLMQAGGRPVSRERLHQQLYGLEADVDSNTLEVHVHALRKVLGRERIETVRGFGYRLVAL